MKLKLISLLVINMMLLIGCSKVTRISHVNMAHGYHEKKSNINVSYLVSHIDKELSLVQFKVPADQLLYVRDARENFYLAGYQITVSLYDSYDQGGHLYTQEHSFTDTLYLDESRSVENEFTLAVPTGKSYTLLFLFEDINRRLTENFLVRTDKKSILSEAFFSLSAVSDSSMHHPPFFLNPQKEFILTHAQDKDFSLEVQRFSLINETPGAPYVTPGENKDEEAEELHFTSDSIYQVDFSGGAASIQLPGNGLYRFSEPGDPELGFSIKSFWKGFPHLPDNDTLLFPLRYITSSHEFDALFSLGDAHLAAERFWAKSTGNPERATTLMQRYNQRVEDANALFSSFVPGWQTDKGMIYIIFGPPDMVFHQNDGETWHYIEGFNSPGAEFHFLKIDNILSDNHYRLERKSDYRRNWNHAVDRWRR